MLGKRVYLASATSCRCFLTVALTLYGVAFAEAVHATDLGDFSVNYDQGYEVGYPVGYDFGFDLGFVQGINEGTADGKTEGYANGWEVTYDSAYDTAYDLVFPVGKVKGFAETFPEAAAEGYQWASEVHRFLMNPINSAILTNSSVVSLIDRWGDPGGWGSSGVILTAYSGGTSGIFLQRLPVEIDWAARYYDEGYGDGYDDGKTLGDQEGFDEAYPLAYEAAYEPAFDQGAEEGTAEGTLVGGEVGFDEGWSIGLDMGESVGFSAGADFYAAGGQLGDLNLANFVSAYATNLAVVESVSVPEPTSLCLGFFGLALVLGRRSRAMA